MRFVDVDKHDSAGVFSKAVLHSPPPMRTDYFITHSQCAHLIDNRNRCRF